ncbi:hypothetical protein RRF57_005752 [Xylaria bambusicola]|uniref:Uncharacterized protein n=1 Tax=Xylaria bambusicola TaxID=326684 RepID=A0AAN7Z694_9PEZI
MNELNGSRVYLDDVSVSVLCEIWPSLRGRRLRQDYYSNLLAYLKRELTVLIRSSHPIKESDVQHILRRLDLLKRDVDKPLNRIFDILRAEYDQPQCFDVFRLGKFLTRAWVNIELDISAYSSRPNGAASEGSDVTSLRQIINERFHNLIPSENAMFKGNLSRLTMRYLVDTYGWTVSWTGDLTEHLSVNPRTKVVKIYEHKICLLHHFEFESLCPIPQEAIKEALDTLNLLFPSEDISTQRYLENEGKSFHRLGSCNRDDYRDLSHYRYWHKGLAQLLSALEEEPLGFKQFVLDRERRNFREVTTFWLAVVVIIFLTLGFGIISTAFAAKGYQVALMQYRLGLAQACSMPGANVSLSRYCT